MSTTHNHLGVQKDVWSIIEEYSKPKLWWYWFRDPSKPQQYSNMANEFKVIEASSEEQAHYIIYRDALGVFPDVHGITIHRKTWEFINKKYDVLDNDCSTCQSVEDSVLRMTDALHLIFCKKHSLTRDMLLDGLNIFHITNVNDLDQEMKRNVTESIHYLTLKKWIEIKKIEW